MAFYPNQLQPYSLAGAGAVMGATSITLKSMLDIDGNALTMLTSFGSVGYATLEPGNNMLEESISFSGLVNNINGTVTLTGIKSITFGQPYTETTGLTKTHAGSTTLVISNTSGYYTQFGVLQNDEDITGFWNAPDPVSNMNIANRQWVLSVVNGGPVSQNSIIEVGNAGETLISGNLVYLNVADGQWYKTDADTAATVNYVSLGIAQGAGTAGFAITGGVLVFGVDATQSGLTPGVIYYASNTAGAISATAGTNSRAIGHAKSVTELYFDPYFKTSVKQNNIDAMDAADSPSATNPFMTFLDTSPGDFGDGSDGAVVISSGTTTLTRNMFYSDLTVNSTGTINTAGYKVYVNGTVTSDTSGGGGGIQNNGGNAGNASGTTGGTAGAASGSGYYAAGRAGQTGAAGGAGGNPGTNGTAGTAETFVMVNSVGSAGGNGGASSGGGNAGGTGGLGGAVSSVASSTPRSRYLAESTFQFTSGTAVARWSIGPGAGSGASGGDGGIGASGAGGGSGGDGGVTFVAARKMILTGTGALRSNGGNGGNGGNGTGSQGGGGGGGAGGRGGVVIAIYITKTGSGTMVATGGNAGTGGTASASGVNGSAGNAGPSGLIIELS